MFETISLEVVFTAGVLFFGSAAGCDTDRLILRTGLLAGGRLSLLGCSSSSSSSTMGLLLRLLDALASGLQSENPDLAL